MKKRTFFITLTIVLLAATLGLRVYVDRTSLHERIVGMIEDSLQAKASAASVSWRWIPTPAITITGLKTESDALTLVVPTAHLILNPKFFLSGSASLLRASLIDPDFLFTKPTATKNLTQKALPLGTIRIENGRLRLPETPATNSVALKPLSLTGINGTLSSRVGQLAFTLTAESTFARMLHLSASLDTRSGKYQVDLAASELASSQLTKDLGTSPSALPLLSPITFTARLQGQGWSDATWHLSSKTVPFSIQEYEQTTTVTAVDCTLTRHDAITAIDINELTLSDPAMSLKGQISRQENMEAGSPNPLWHMDLRGTNIDLAAGRSAILARFPSNPIAQKVCSIVTGGMASTARYTFDGKTTDFHHLEAMQIWANALDVPVVVPGIELKLDRASGPISIIGGQLTGENLQADIDKSHGENGKLLLDLRHDYHDFRLDLDLTADLTNLKDVLTQVVPSPGFQKELRRFTNVGGLAKGHLRLGDDLRQLETHVDVASMQGHGNYNRLPWPFTVGSGTLTVAPQEVEWRNVRGSIGRQQINKTHGSVNWYDDVEADLDALDADLDLSALYNEGSVVINGATLSAREGFHGTLEALTGQASLRNTTFSGGLGQPQQWRFHSLVSAHDLKVSGPGFPELTSHTVEGETDQDQVRFTGIFSLLDQELFLDGRYKHKLFRAMRGSLTLNGEVKPRLGAWIQEKQLIPTTLFPNLPFRVEQLTLSAPDPSTGASQARGTIISLAPGSQARAQLDINRQPEQVSEKITFVDGKRTGTLSYQAWPREEKQSVLSWQGDLAAKTFDDLFQQHILRDGVIHGAFHRLTTDQAAIYSGEIQLEGLRFSQESLFPDLSINTLHLAGDSHGMRIDQADMALAGSDVQVAGSFSDATKGRILDLTITAPNLASGAIQKALDSIKDNASPSQQSSFRKTIGGTIAINIGTFDYILPPPEETKPDEASSQTISMTPLQGVLIIKPASFDLDFKATRVCGLSAQGAWHFGDTAADNVVRFSSGTEPLFFEQALPCLGFKQSLITGPFTTEGEISGRPRAWKEGTITLSSKEGLIRRMNLLSKIFTAVNFTDYFTWQDLPDVNAEGLAYNELTIKAHIENNAVSLDKTSIKGKGVNLTGRGTIDLANYDSDLTFFVAPFKMVDSIITGIPLVGRALGGPKESILTFPVKVTGNIKAPEVTSLAPEAVGTAAWEMLIDTLTLPYRILHPARND